MKLSFFLIISCSLFSCRAQNYFTVWESTHLTEVYSCKNCDSMEIGLLSIEKLKLNPKDYTQYSNDLLVYQGRQKLTFKELSKYYNPFYRTGADGIMKSLKDDANFVKIDSNYFVIDDTLCNPTGIDSLPDGKFQFVDIIDNGLNIFQEKTIKNFKIDGVVKTGNSHETIIYKEGYQQYYKNEFGKLSYIEIKYDSCGKLIESISVHNGKTVAFENTTLGFGIILNPESGNVETIYTIKKGVKNGLYHSFDIETGKYSNTINYLNGHPFKFEK